MVKLADTFAMAKHIEEMMSVESAAGLVNVFSNETIVSDEYVYDPLDVELHQEYYSNGIVSHNCQFLGSSGTLIAGWKLKELGDERRVPVKANEGLFQYEAPKKSSVYALVADVSRGKGLDYSAFSVIDVTVLPYKQVCVYRSNKTTPADYADTIHQTARLYNSAYILVEVNDIGEQVAWHIHDQYEYENLLWTENGGAKGKKITNGFGQGTSRDMGIKTTLPVRTSGCSMLKLIVEQNKLLLYDTETISELSTFSKKNAKYEAEPGKHDDIVMGLVLFAWMTNQQYFKDLTNINTLAEARDRTEKDVLEDVMEFGFVDVGAPVEVLTNEEVREGWLMVDDEDL